jgi:hypothetical protein
MQRKDKEMSNWATIKAFLDKECILHLAMIDGNEPYMVTLNYGIEGKKLFFHSSQKGRKMDILSRPQGNLVCFMVSRFHGIVKQEINSSEPHFSSRYQSVFGCGTVRCETDPAVIRHGLNLIVFQAIRKKTDYAFPSCQDRVNLLRLDIEKISGKDSAMKGWKDL